VLAAGFKPVRQTLQGLLFGSIPKPVFIFKISIIKNPVESQVKGNGVKKINLAQKNEAAGFHRIRWSAIRPYFKLVRRWPIHFCGWSPFVWPSGKLSGVAR